MSRETVIRQIVERDLQNKGLSDEDVLEEAQELHAAACEFFGTWETALRYAGISVRRTRSRNFRGSAVGRRAARHPVSGTKAVLREIRRLCVSGYNLSASQNARRDRSLYDAARRHFGSWREALSAVGLKLENAHLLGRPRKLKKDELIIQLRQRHESGLSLAWRIVCLDNHAFATAVKRAFGSWRRALAAAGLASEQTAVRRVQKWNQQRILEAIKLRHQAGKPLRCTRVREDDSGLVSAARQFFATWDEAVAAAEITDP